MRTKSLAILLSVGIALSAMSAIGAAPKINKKGARPKGGDIVVRHADKISYDEVLTRGLKVMDLSAICMCKDNGLPIVVFNMDVVGNLKKVINGEGIGTLVHP